jgi:Xaa-Pro dipeptidase
MAANDGTPTVTWEIQQPEYDERVRRTRAILAERALDGIVLFHSIRIAYLSGFFHAQTERPMAIIVPADEGKGLGALIPQLEQEHIAKSPGVKHVKVYPEYPSGGTQHPLRHLGDLLREMGLGGKRLGYDSDGYGDVNGYDGPLLSEVHDGPTERARDIVDGLRQVKSEAELRLIGESAKWGNLAHQIMHRKLARSLGRSEIEVYLEASAEASGMMIQALGPSYRPASFFTSPALVMFHAGANTAFPHGLSKASGLRRGDVLVTGATADVGGYHSELERTMILGDPMPEFEKHFGIMMQLQQAGFDALKPGRTLASAEEEISRVYADLGVAHLQRHHTGHGIGLEGHEAPFIDKGDEREIKEGMVFSVEPGIYVPGLAGFRHSDTVVIRAGGAELLTYYPRDLESMIVPL